METKNPNAPELEAGRAAFTAQRRAAKRRGIPFLFAFEEWWAWWQIDSRWERRGRGKDQLVMARVGDIGPYSPDNVQCITAGQNVRDVRPEARAEAVEKMRVTCAAGGSQKAWSGWNGWHFADQPRAP